MELIKDFWGLIAGIAAILIWGVRVESGMLGNRKDIKRIEEQIEKNAATADRQRDKMEDKLDAIHDRLHEVLVLLGQKADRK